VEPSCELRIHEASSRVEFLPAKAAGRD
jgi:hypothetical protein